MQNLLPYRRAWPSLDTGDQFPVDPEQQQAEKGCKHKFRNQIITR
jgi:hypothetical protein